MIKLKYFIILLIVANNLFGQNSCGINVDTAKILQDESLDSFLSNLQVGGFQTFTSKSEIPEFVKQQLDCLTEDKFSLANPNEKYRCCCTSSSKLPRRKLLFFSTSKDIFLITYLTGGIGVSTTILMFKLQNEKIIDLWSGFAFAEFKSKEQVVEHIKLKRGKIRGLHSNYIYL